jgi:transposase
MNGLALQVQEALRRDPHAGDLFVFRGARGDLINERVIVPGPTACLCCGGGRLRKLGETVTETLESIPRQWKVIQHVREKFTCRDCEKISQAPAPFHVIARGWAGPNLLAMILFEKFGQHQPLNRQAERYAKEGVPLSLSGGRLRGAGTDPQAY